MGRLLADVTPLRTSPDFRRLWATTGLSSVGSQMTTFAVALQVYLATHSSGAVGALALTAAAPSVVVGLLGGALIDSVDRRRLVLGTTLLLALVSGTLAVQAGSGGGRLGVLFGLVAVQAAAGAVNGPARRTFVPRLLPAAELPAAIALTMLAMHVSLLIGPALGGLLAAAGGVRLCYLVDALSFAASLYGVARLPAIPPDGSASRPDLRAVIDGLRYVRRTPVLAGALLSDVNATVLAMPVALFPALNAERFGGSPRTLGLFMAALATGGILGTTLSGPIGAIRRSGRGMLGCGAVWGLALAAFGAVTGLAATLVCLVVAGAADVSSVTLRSTIVQRATTEAYRGRVTATEYVTGVAMPDVGNLRAGVVGTLTTPGISAISGGLAAAIGTAVLALACPALRRYRPVVAGSRQPSASASP